ncbi:MAG: cephalosporin-C deacetylase-like acetyl esterase [Phycisphaerales bacterium]|jgi:cephalosporin-C deacetylase-like acetyl esterase
MSALPEDFGLSPVRTLARVADPTPARQHRPFWSSWFETLASHRPMLMVRRPGDDESDPTATHEFISTGDVRIGCRLIRPTSGPIHAGLVTSHGYHVAEALESDAQRWQPLADRGVAVLAIRVRGYPGSRRDVGDLTKPDHAGGGWITRGLAASSPGLDGDRAWVVPQAVADVANACRALRNALLDRTENDLHGITLGATAPKGAPHPQLYLHGESLGGGLAILAAAMLAGKVPNAALIDRLVLGLPTFGDWPWRLKHASQIGGTGREVADLINRHRKIEDLIRERVRLADAVIHADRVRAPSLVKLASRDEIVPAPTQAAVFNSLGCDPGRRWRFITSFGHHDGGIANARRHALFERAAMDFLDPSKTPEQAMIPWEPLLSDGGRTPEGEAPEISPQAQDTTDEDATDQDRPSPDRPSQAKATASLFPDAPPPDNRDAALIGAYERAGRTLDSLPYTPEFASIFEAAHAAGFATERDTFHRLHNLRKAGKLPRLGKAPDSPPAIEPEEEAALVELVTEAAGSLGQRDRLPFTPEFDLVAERFSEQTGRALTPHDLWRLIAKLAK